MLNITPENIQIAEKNMLPALQQVFYGEQTQEALEYIAHTHQVSEFELSANVGYVLLGLVPVAQLVDELQESCDVSQEHALEIVVDVRKYVLASVAGDLVSIQEIAKKNYNTYKQP